MSNTQINLVTWSLALLPENAAKIDEINQIILGKSNNAKAPIEEAKSTVEEKTESSGISQADLQAAAKEAKAEYGIDFVKECIEAAGGTLKRALGQSLASIDVEAQASFIQDLKDGPKQTEQASDELEDDDDLDDDLDDDVPEIDAVKAALKAYAKEVGRDEAKAIMQKYGASALSKVDECTPAQLTKMFAELV